MPPYPGVSQVMEISSQSSSGHTTISTSISNNKSDIEKNESTTKAKIVESDNDNWESDYAEYLAEKAKETSLKDSTTNDGTKAMKVNKNDEEWALQYYKYLEEKGATEKQKQNENCNDDDEDWAVEYAKYQSKKEKELESKED